MRLYIMSGESLIMDYFDNLDNEYLNKYKKNLKMKKKNSLRVFPLLD
jgi:hypothetical protein